MLFFICTGTVSQTLQGAAKVACQFVYDEHLEMKYEADDVQEDVLVHDETAFFEVLAQEFDDVDEEYDDSADYTCFLYRLFDQAFWNQLHTVIFGADT